MGCRATRSLASPLLFSLSFLFLAAASHGQDTLTQVKSLQDGQTLVSLGRVFELGFFTPPGANSSLRYVGVWYYGLRPLALIWVANRNNPVLGSSGKITISIDGNMEVLDGGGGRRWSTNESFPPAPPAGASAVLQLVDTGNLFLNASEGGTVRWQSFEHPTDTFLPGMRVPLDKATGRGLRFRSWRSESDPAEGNYSLGLDPAGSGQVFIWGGETPRWRSGVLSGGMFTGIRVKPLAFYGWNLDDLGGEVGEMVLTFRPFNASLIRFALQWDGRVNAAVLDSRTGGWRTAILEPDGVCDLYNRCGANAVCVAGAVGACECLKGFQPRVTGEWKAGNWSGGCARRTPVRCEANGTAGEEDGFGVVKGVKLPDGSSWRIADEGGCERGCVGNCSCTAFAYTAEVGCLTWSAALADVQQFPDGGIDLHVKLAGSELGNGHKNKIWIVILIIALFVVVVFLLSFYLCWRYRAKIKGWREKSGTGEVSLADPGDRGEALPEFINPTQFVDQTKDGKSSELPLLSFDSIAAATENFSKSNKLGEGGFGLVYKGILPDGREIAVKRLSATSGQGLEEFKNEVILIAKLQHRNLVRLMACCIQETEKILIYEYLPNKSLDAFIFDPEKKPLLDWRKRFNIIVGIARGLVYLHRDSRLRIIHRDLKASNILLDEEMNPKISDFGMARIFGGNQNQLNTNRVVGTFGYMSPEYAMEGVFSIKSDVFSFGVLILEIISGQRNSGFPRTENSPNLVGYAWKLWNEDRPLELVDPSIQSSISPREVTRCIQVGLLCVQDRANERPTMSSVVFMLGNEAMAQTMPKQPTFTLEGSPTETESVAMEAESFASRDVSISVVTGR